MLHFNLLLNIIPIVVIVTRLIGLFMQTYMYVIIKLESKTQDECVYLLSGGHLTTNTVQTRKFYVNTIYLKKITCNKERDRKDT